MLTADWRVLFADPYGALFASSPLPHARPPCSPPHYPLHYPMHYHYNYPPYHYLMPPGNKRMCTTYAPFFTADFLAFTTDYRLQCTLYKYVFITYLLYSYMILISYI